MTLDEAIQHTREVACENHDCAYEHKQLAGWLQELKQSREYIERLENALCNSRYIGKEGQVTCLDRNCTSEDCFVCPHGEIVDLINEILEKRAEQC